MNKIPKIEEIDDVECDYCGHYTEDSIEGFDTYTIHNSSSLKRESETHPGEYYIVMCEYCAHFQGIGYPLYVSMDTVNRNLAMGFHVLEKRLLEKLNK